MPPIVALGQMGMCPKMRPVHGRDEERKKEDMMSSRFKFGMTLRSLKVAKLLLLPTLVRHLDSIEDGVAHCRSRLRVCSLIGNAFQLRNVINVSKCRKVICTSGLGLHLRPVAGVHIVQIPMPTWGLGLNPEFLYWRTLKFVHKLKFLNQNFILQIP